MSCLYTYASAKFISGSEHFLWMLAQFRYKELKARNTTYRATTHKHSKRAPPKCLWHHPELFLDTEFHEDTLQDP